MYNHFITKISISLIIVVYMYNDNNKSKSRPKDLVGMCETYEARIRGAKLVCLQKLIETIST